MQVALAGCSVEVFGVVFVDFCFLCVGLGSVSFLIGSRVVSPIEAAQASFTEHHAISRNGCPFYIHFAACVARLNPKFAM